MKTVIISRLKIIAEDENIISSIFKTLHPDNIDVPLHMKINDRIEHMNKKYIYVLEIKVDVAEKFNSIRGTLDEVLSLLSVIDKILTHK